MPALPISESDKTRFNPRRDLRPFVFHPAGIARERRNDPD